MENANPPEIQVVKCKPGRKRGYADKDMIIRFIPRSEQKSHAEDQSKSKRHSQSTLF